jgi:hypothetical protein
MYQDMTRLLSKIVIVLTVLWLQRMTEYICPHQGVFLCVRTGIGVIVVAGLSMCFGGGSVLVAGVTLARLILVKLTLDMDWGEWTLGTSARFIIVCWACQDICVNDLPTLLYGRKEAHVWGIVSMMLVPTYMLTMQTVVTNEPRELYGGLLLGCLYVDAHRYAMDMYMRAW